MVYSFSKEEARAAIQLTARVIRAITMLDQFEDERLAGMAHIKEQIASVASQAGASFGEGDASDAELEARAKHTALVDQLHALRGTLADVLVDARLVAAEGLLAADVEPGPLEPAPRVLGGLVLQPLDLPNLLRQFERWYAQSSGACLRELKLSLAALRRFVAARDDQAFQQLVRDVDQVLLRM